MLFSSKEEETEDIPPICYNMGNLEDLGLSRVRPAQRDKHCTARAYVCAQSENVKFLGTVKFWFPGPRRGIGASWSELQTHGVSDPRECGDGLRSRTVYLKSTE
jgi:hypothetical protein